MLKWFLLSTLFVGNVFAEVSLTLQGDFVQGGMVIGKSNSPIKTAHVDGVKVPIHPNKTLFSYGYGRDSKVNSQLIVVFENGQSKTEFLTIKQREYEVDRVNGVEQKYVSPPETVLNRIRNDSKMVKAARSKTSLRSDFTQQVIQPAQGRISGVYGSQRVFNGVPKRPHFGLDIAAPTGTQVIAPWSGQVVLSEPDLYYSGGTLILDHGMGITTTYIHLSKLHVEVGQVIEQGQLIAEIGATGRVTGAHLDWRLNWFNRRLDPQLLLD